jgi:metal-responsive CopG/Arc/MetJ family transcriptional regulator
MPRINLGISIHQDILAELTRIAAREREAGGREARTRNRIIEDALAEYIRTHAGSSPQAATPPHPLDSRGRMREGGTRV